MQVRILSPPFKLKKRGYNICVHRKSELEELRAIRKELAEVKRELKKKEDTSYWAMHPIDTGCGAGKHNPFSPI